MSTPETLCSNPADVILADNLVSWTGQAANVVAAYLQLSTYNQSIYILPVCAIGWGGVGWRPTYSCQPTIRAYTSFQCVLWGGVGWGGGLLTAVNLQSEHVRPS